MIADGSHNSHGMKKTLISIKKDFLFEEIITVIGVLRGHNLDEILNEFVGINSKFVAVNSREPRALPSKDVFDILLSKKIPLIGFENSVSEGIKIALTNASKNSLILVTGSLSVAAEARESPPLRWGQSVGAAVEAARRQRPATPLSPGDRPHPRARPR